MSDLHRQGACDRCGRPNLVEDGREIRGCLCSYLDHPHRRHGTTLGGAVPMPEIPLDRHEPSRVLWPWDRHG